MACLAVALLALCASLIASLWSPAHAVDAIIVKPEQEKIDITALGELYEGRGDRLQIETAPGRDGYVGRMAVQATTAGTNPGWLVFALTNPTNERITRWLVAPRYTLANSRVASPELDAGRIAAITPSLGFRPERMKSDRADMFRLSLEPGQTVTFAAEMASRQVPGLMLWDPEVYQAKQQDRMLFNGVLLGITGLLAIFLTAIFAANHRAIFPATALVAWAVLAYFCVDFGYWTSCSPSTPSMLRSIAQRCRGGVAASLVLFLYCLPSHRAVAWLDQDPVLVLDRRPVRPRGAGHHRSAPRLGSCPRLHGRHRRHRHLPDRLSCAARPGSRAAAHRAGCCCSCGCSARP